MSAPSFIDDIEEVDTQLLMVRTIIDLANALDLYTVRGYRNLITSANCS